MPWLLLIVALILAAGVAIAESHIRKVARALATLRQIAQHDARTRPASPTDLPHRDDQRLFDSVTDNVQTLGYQSLGRVVDLNLDGSTAGLVEWFVDPQKTVCGFFGVAVHSTIRAPVVVLFSESATGEFFLTRCGAGEGFLAGPSTFHRAVAPWSGDLQALATHHRRSVEAVVDAARDLIEVHTLDGALALRSRMMNASRAWRTSQPPDWLRDADVKSFLGSRYPGLGPLVVRKLLKWAA